MVFSPAPPELGAVRLFPGRPGIAGRNDGVIIVHDDCSKIPAKAGPLVGAAEGKVEEVLVTVGSHQKKVCPVTDKRMVLSRDALFDAGFQKTAVGWRGRYFPGCASHGISPVEIFHENHFWA